MQRHEDILIKDEDMIMLDEIRAAMAELEYAGIIEQLVRCGGVNAAASGSRFTLSPNLDAHCPPPESGLTSIKIRKGTKGQTGVTVGQSLGEAVYDPYCG